MNSAEESRACSAQYFAIPSSLVGQIHEARRARIAGLLHELDLAHRQMTGFTTVLHLDGGVEYAVLNEGADGHYRESLRAEIARLEERIMLLCAPSILG
ncbi:hypothetical protein [Oerskovia sp. Root22]|uniref:hypothetical protein n=1 Tax=Oerskovia sp. Root22 TaxID=1736494 RepID=UPI0012F79AD8|nr:hypothetical protein [Oerskovia sp. Root22]